MEGGSSLDNGIRHVVVKQEPNEDIIVPVTSGRPSSPVKSRRFEIMPESEYERVKRARVREIAGTFDSDQLHVLSPNAHVLNQTLVPVTAPPLRSLLGETDAGNSSQVDPLEVLENIVVKSEDITSMDPPENSLSIKGHLLSETGTPDEKEQQPTEPSSSEREQSLEDFSDLEGTAQPASPEIQPPLNVPSTPSRSSEARFVADLFRRMTGVFVRNPVTKKNEFVQLAVTRESFSNAEVQTDISGTTSSVPSSVGTIPLEAGWSIHLAVIQKSAGTGTPIVLRIPESGDNSAVSAAISSSMASSSTASAGKTARDVDNLRTQVKVEKNIRRRVEKQLLEARKRFAFEKDGLEVALAQSCQTNTELRQRVERCEQEAHRKISELKHELDRARSHPLSVLDPRKEEILRENAKLRTEVADMQKKLANYLLAKDEAKARSSIFRVTSPSTSRIAAAVSGDLDVSPSKVDFPSAASVDGSDARSTTGTLSGVRSGSVSIEPSKVQNMFTCDACGRNCGTSAALKHHSRRVHTPASKILHCLYCGQSKKRRDHLVLHESKCASNPNRLASDFLAGLGSGDIRSRESSSRSSESPPCVPIPEMWSL